MSSLPVMAAMMTVVQTRMLAVIQAGSIQAGMEPAVSPTVQTAVKRATHSAMHPTSIIHAISMHPTTIIHAFHPAILYDYLAIIYHIGIIYPTIHPRWQPAHDYCTLLHKISAMLLQNSLAT
jgi:hypothetical protein